MRGKLHLGQQQQTKAHLCATYLKISFSPMRRNKSRGNSARKKRIDRVTTLEVAKEITENINTKKVKY